MQSKRRVAHLPKARRAQDVLLVDILHYLLGLMGPRLYIEPSLMGRLRTAPSLLSGLEHAIQDWCRCWRYTLRLDSNKGFISFEQARTQMQLS